MKCWALAVGIVLLPATIALAGTGSPPPTTGRGDAMIGEYFALETARLRDACLARIGSLEEWKARRETYRAELAEMLGLDPMPARTDLKATITGRIEKEDFAVEKLHFQSRPGLYVTANLYLPKTVDKPVPAILYVCGHGGVKKDGVSFGNKVHYQHHGIWFARNGYVCLVIDSLQLGEIEGIHHGTYRYKMWWWNNRGYTPAGVEAWNCIRALDYLQSRKEVDPKRMGVSGRSGGGAYSWWIAALDERIKVAVPVAGITDLQNHVVDGTVEGHCDCMFFVNTYRWDYPLVAALVAPRPLMIGNTDRDRIFPLDGVIRTYEKVRTVYELYGAGGQLGLNITPGPHKDTQELRVPAFRWFNQHLKGDESLITMTAKPMFQPEELKVFDKLPEDEKNTTIQESFVPCAPAPEVPPTAEAWGRMRDAWRTALEQKSFRGWPNDGEPLDVQRAFEPEQDGLRLRAYDFTSQGPIRLRLYLLESAGRAEPKKVELRVLDEPGWSQLLGALRARFAESLQDETPVAPDAARLAALGERIRRAGIVLAFVAPRGVGPTAWNPSEKKRTQIRRRFMLLGQTLDGMRVWDARRAIQTLRALPETSRLPLVVCGEREAAGIVLYAGLFEPDLAGLKLGRLGPTHRQGPILLNVRRYLDLPQTVAMAAERCPVELVADDFAAWEFPRQVARQLGWGEDRLRLVREPPGDENPTEKHGP